MLIRKNAQKVIKNLLKAYGVKIEICFQTSNSLKQDVDNVIKPILDALNGVAYIDDSQVMSVKAIAIPRHAVIECESSSDLASKVLEKEIDECAIAIYDLGRILSS